MKSYKICILVFSLILLLGDQGFSQETTPRLSDLWEQVKENYPGIKGQNATIKAAEFREKEIRGNRLPQINTQFQNTYGTYNGVPGAFFPLPGLLNVSGASSPTDKMNMPPNTFGSVTLNWEFFAFGKNKSTNQAFRSLTRSKEAGNDAYLLSLKEELAKRYLELTYQQALQIWNQKTVNRFGKIRTITTALASAGLKPAADSLLALASYNQVIGKESLLKGNREAAQIRIQELTGVELSSFPVVNNHFLNPLNRESEAIEFQEHPLLVQQKLQTEYFDKSSRSAKQSMLPTLNLLGGYAFRGTGIGKNGLVSHGWQDGFSNSANNLLVGLGLTWNITGIYARKQQAKSLKMEAENSREQERVWSQKLEYGIKSTEANLSHQIDNLHSNTLAVKQAEEAYLMYLARYQNGLIDLTTLLQIQNLLEQAEKSQIVSALYYWQSVIEEAQYTNHFDYLFQNF